MFQQVIFTGLFHKDYFDEIILIGIFQWDYFDKIGLTRLFWLKFFNKIILPRLFWRDYFDWNFSMRLFWQDCFDKIILVRLFLQDYFNEIILTRQLSWSHQAVIRSCLAHFKSSKSVRFVIYFATCGTEKLLICLTRQYLRSKYQMFCGFMMQSYKLWMPIW